MKYTVSGITSGVSGLPHSVRTERVVVNVVGFTEDSHIGLAGMDHERQGTEEVVDIQSPTNETERKSVQDRLSSLRERLKRQKISDDKYVEPEWATRILESSDLQLDCQHFHKYLEPSLPQLNQAAENDTVPLKLVSQLKDGGSYLYNKVSTATEPESGTTSKKDESNTNKNAAAAVDNGNKSIKNQVDKAMHETKKTSKPSSSTLARFRESVASIARKAAATKDQTVTQNIQETNSQIQSQTVTIPVPKMAQEEKTYLQMMWDLPQNIQYGLGFGKVPLPPEKPSNNTKMLFEELRSDSQMRQRTQAICDYLYRAQSNMAKRKRLDELCNHLREFPEFRHIAAQVFISNFISKSIYFYT